MYFSIGFVNWQRHLAAEWGHSGSTNVLLYWTNDKSYANLTFGILQALQLHTANSAATLHTSVCRWPWCISHGTCLWPRAGYCGPKNVLRYIAISKNVLQYIAIFINLIWTLCIVDVAGQPLENSDYRVFWQLFFCIWTINLDQYLCWNGSVVAQSIHHSSDKRSKQPI